MNQTKEGCVEAQTPKEELLIKKCWKPDCNNIAVVRDGADWEWCDKHLNQENSNSSIHTEAERYDVVYYRDKAKKFFQEAEQRVAREWKEKMRVWAIDMLKPVKEVEDKHQKEFSEQYSIYQKTGRKSAEDFIKQSESGLSQGNTGERQGKIEILEILIKKLS